MARRWWQAALVCGLLGALGLALLTYHWTRTPLPRPLDANGGQPLDVAGTSDPRLTFRTPFENVRPQVKYVGDEVCARCHADQARTFREHPMGRSLAPQASAIKATAPTANNPFDALGFQYAVEKRGDRYFHRETRRDAQGKVLFATEMEANYAVGSGSHGRSYLMERDGILLMSPITWYPEKGLWDLSPGYRQQHQHFGRPVTAECLFCHCNHATKVPHTFNKFVKPIFQGFSIGCERCHGPGELHVQRRERDEVTRGIDHAIVNPRHLPPELREAVCEQCHLQAQRRIARRGSDSFDFRPGLPLHLFMSVFVQPPELSDNNKFVGQVEQMRASRCFLGSGGRLGCVSCHDPHRQPKPEERVAFYRQRCLNCHQDRGCNVPLATRQQTSATDSCIQCHMPAGDASITHVSISDHRVPRRADASGRAPAAPARLRAGQMPLVHFHKGQAGVDEAGVQRDLGIALMELVSRTPESAHETLGRLALPLLRKAAADHPDDLDALDARGQAEWLQGRPTDAVETLRQILEKIPDREPTLDAAATMYMGLGRFANAIAAWEKAVKINPQRWRYWSGLASAHARLGEWNQALHAADQTLTLNPANVEARFVRVLGLIERRDMTRAAAEFAIIQALNPPDLPDLKKRFDERLPKSESNAEPRTKEAQRPE